MKFLVLHEAGRVGVGLGLARVLVGGDALVRVVEHAPHDAQPRHLGRARTRLFRRLGRLDLDGLLFLLFLGRFLVLLVALAFTLLLFLAFLFAFLFLFLAFLFVLVRLFFLFLVGLFVLFAPFRGVKIGPQVLAVQDAPSHEHVLRVGNPGSGNNH
jgi:hypothetical protein